MHYSGGKKLNSKINQSINQLKKKCSDNYFFFIFVLCSEAQL